MQHVSLTKLNNVNNTSTTTKTKIKIYTQNKTNTLFLLT